MIYIEFQGRGTATLDNGDVKASNEGLQKEIESIGKPKKRRGEYDPDPELTYGNYIAKELRGNIVGYVPEILEVGMVQ